MLKGVKILSGAVENCAIYEAIQTGSKKNAQRRPVDSVAEPNDTAQKDQ